MKNLISLLIVFAIFSCSQGHKNYLPESEVQKVFESKYDSLRANLKDSLAQGIQNVNDYGHIFLTSEVRYLDSLIVDFNKQAGIQLVIFTFDSLMTSKDSVDAVTQIIAFRNRIPTTIGLSIPNKAVSIWNDSLINNTIFTSSEAQYMIDHKFIPFFKGRETFKGTVEGLKAIMQRMNNNKAYNKSLRKDAE